MLTRRHIRVKVMQIIYALKKGDAPDIDAAHKFLNVSIAQMFSLYLLNLSLLKELHSMAMNRVQLNQKRYLKSTDDEVSSVGLAENIFLKQIQANKRLEEELAKRKLKNWYLNEDYVKIIYKELLTNKSYQNFNPKSQNYEEHKNLVIHLFKQVIAPNDKLYEYFEDERLTWVDDLPIVNTFFVKKLKNAKEDKSEEFFLPKLLKDEQDMTYAKQLLDKTILKESMWEEEIQEKTPNWDKERIAEVDLILLKMALCEFEHFHSIPERVTINEYLEIAKEYSTPKSSLFINGILDKLAKEYKESGRMVKIGRGLL